MGTGPGTGPGPGPGPGTGTGTGSGPGPGTGTGTGSGPGTGPGTGPGPGQGQGTGPGTGPGPGQGPGTGLGTGTGPGQGPGTGPGTGPGPGTGKIEGYTMKEYKIVRAQHAGVFAGLVVARRGNEVDMEEARRIWYWDGAASLSELATHGTAKPENCNFAVPITLTVFGVIEIIEVSKKARESILAVKEWTV